MKNIKKYDSFRYRGEWIYFKLFIEHNIKKYKIAIEKTGYSNLFYNCYSLQEDEQDYNINHPDIIYMVFNPNNEIPGRCQCEFYDEQDKYMLDNYNNLKYGGEIHVYDYELAANKYNL